jgi:hypothetical protein
MPYIGGDVLDQGKRKNKNKDRERTHGVVMLELDYC